MKILKWLVVAVLLLVAVLIFNAWRFTPKKVSLPDVSVKLPYEVSPQTALKHFAKALTFKTIASEDQAKDYSIEFEKLQAFLKQTYPKAFNTFSLKRFGKYSLLLKWQGSDSSLQPVLFMAHQDVVPIAKDKAKAWQQGPFSGAIADGIVWGRGAIDDKSSLIGLLEATEALLRQGFTPKRTVYFYFGADEETGGKTALEASNALKAAGIHFAYVFDEGGFLASNMFAKINQTVALIGTAEKGYINVNLQTESRGGHSSMPPKITAIGRLSSAINKLQKQRLPASLNIITKELFETLGRHMPFKDRLIPANLWLLKKYFLKTLEQKSFTNALIRTTTAPTIFHAGVKSNVLPKQAKATINFRIAPGETTDSVVNHVRQTIADPKVKLTTAYAWNPSSVSSTNSPGYRVLSAAIYKTLGKDIIISPWILVGGSDSRHFIQVSDNVLRFVPYHLDVTDLKRFHGTNERLPAKSFLEIVRFYHFFFQVMGGEF